ncbi:MAG: ribonuclease HII [Candidatus Mycalebacterium zealandia]|nr:MAG: ribonuclease HII [Candidatus Mycalebacterium zealandia]
MEIWARGLVPAGVDEAGRGPIAGPVVAAAAILPEEFCLPEVDDSKKLSQARREMIFSSLSDSGVVYATGTADPREIDEINILRATIKAMERAVAALKVSPDFLLIDGNTETSLPLKQRAIVGGDGKCMSIAVASIIAKVTRDGMMKDLHNRYPLYNFSRHKGYPTREHRELVETHGPCPEHRKSFKLTG